MDLLILGASARSAAFSAIRAGLRPVAVDLFADLDLKAACPAIRVEPADYPEGLARAVEALPPTPWLYTGAIENRPDLVDRIAARHPLLGNPGATLRRARDPLALASIVRRAGLPAPGVRLEPEGVPIDGSWLVKPLASGGGRGIRTWRGGAWRGSYFQERIEGVSIAALFVAEGGVARIQGITRQFVGRPGNRFAYRGSLGPWPVSDRTWSEIAELGWVLTSAFGLDGIFGLDLILRDGRAWPIEINPRYTASVEVLEWVFGSSILDEHLRVFGRSAPSGGMGFLTEPFVGKAILHATRPSRWDPPAGLAIPRPGEFPEIADLPRPGTAFRPGEPVLTVFAQGKTVDDCRRALGARLRAWRGRLRPGC